MKRLLLHFRQAWQILKQEKLFSTIYILGTALSIMMVMVLAIIMHIRLANIYPETNRDRTLSISRAMVKHGSGNSSSSVSLDFIRQVLFPLENAEAVTAIYHVYEGGYYAQSQDRKKQYPIWLKYTDDSFWKVFPFRFIAGTPFTAADLESGLSTVIIAESLAKQLFGTTNVVGEQVSINFRWCRICGVVRDASYVTPDSYAMVWMPYTACPVFKPAWYPERTGNALGNFTAYILAPSSGQLNDLDKEIRTNIEKFNQLLGEELEFSVYGQPNRHWQKVIRGYDYNMGEDYNFHKELLKYVGFFVLLLVIPAVCLSGMADSRMERRISELGVRRAFGARNSSLFMQVVGENLFFTLLGGLLGLLLSYTVIYFLRSWIMNVIQYVGTLSEGVEVYFTPGMLFNWQIFLIAFLICIILNVLSAFIPAWKASRKEIVESLKTE